MEDCYDVAWSPDDRFIVVALTDNSAQIWDLSSRSSSFSSALILQKSALEY